MVKPVVPTEASIIGVRSRTHGQLLEGALDSRVFDGVSAFAP